MKQDNQEPSSVEKEMLDAWIKDPTVAAYRSFLGNKTILLYNGHVPSVNSDSLDKWLDRKILWKTTGGKTAASGDLGFTYGMLQKTGEQKTAGTYVRIWKKYSGDWKIIVDVMNPAP